MRRNSVLRAVLEFSDWGGLHAAGRPRGQEPRAAPVLSTVRGGPTAYTQPGRKYGSVENWCDNRAAAHLKAQLLPHLDTARRGAAHGRTRLVVGELFRAMADLRAAGAEIGTRTYTVALWFCSWAGRTRAVRRLLREMRQGGVPRTPRCYALLLRALAMEQPEGGRGAGASAVVAQVLEQMQSDGVSPESRVWTEALRVYSRAGDIRGCDEVWSALLHDGHSPTTELFMLRIAGCGSGADGRRYFAEMLSMGIAPAPHHFAALLKACWRSADGAVAEEAVEAMETGTWTRWNPEAQSPSSVPCSAAVRSRPARAARGGAVLQADRPVWNALLSVHAAAADLPAARGVLTRMQERSLQPDAITYAAFITVCAAALRRDGGDTAEAESAFATGQRDGCGGSRRLYRAMLRVYAATGDVAGARRLRLLAEEAGVPENGSFMQQFAEVFRAAAVDPEPGELEPRGPFSGQVPLSFRGIATDLPGA